MKKGTCAGCVSLCCNNDPYPRRLMEQSTLLLKQLNEVNTKYKKLTGRDINDDRKKRKEAKGAVKQTDGTVSSSSGARPLDDAQTPKDDDAQTPKDDGVPADETEEVREFLSPSNVVVSLIHDHLPCALPFLPFQNTPGKFPFSRVTLREVGVRELLKFSTIYTGLSFVDGKTDTTYANSVSYKWPSNLLTLVGPSGGGKSSFVFVIHHVVNLLAACLSMDSVLCDDGSVNLEEAMKLEGMAETVAFWKTNLKGLTIR
jgi:hypothetical protein